MRTNQRAFSFELCGVRASGVVVTRDKMNSRLRDLLNKEDDATQEEESDDSYAAMSCDDGTDSDTD